MKAYEIVGNANKNSMSEFPEEFKGLFITSTEHIIRGYVEEKMGINSSLSFILGFLDENRLAFFKLSNEVQTLPFMYLFKNYKEAGKWGAIELFVGMPYILGSAKVNITEVCDKTIVEKRVRKEYSKMQGGCENFNTSAERYIPILKTWLYQIG